MFVLGQKSDIRIITSELTEHFSVDYSLQGGDRLNFAVGLVSYEDPSFALDDPTYGQLSIHTVKFGIDDATLEAYEERIEHDWHWCTQEDLGLTKDTSNAALYPISSRSVNDLRRFSRSLICLDDPDKLYV